LTLRPRVLDFTCTYWQSVIRVAVVDTRLTFLLRFNELKKPLLVFLFTSVLALLHDVYSRHLYSGWWNFTISPKIFSERLGVNFFSVFKCAQPGLPPRTPRTVSATSEHIRFLFFLVLVFLIFSAFLFFWFGAVD